MLARRSQVFGQALPPPHAARRSAGRVESGAAGAVRRLLSLPGGAERGDARRDSAGQANDPGRRRLHLALEAATDAVFRVAQVQGGALKFTAEQLVRALAAGGQFGTLGLVGWNDKARARTRALVQEASTPGDAGTRHVLIGMLDAFFAVEPRMYGRALSAVEQLLPMSGLTPADVPALGRMDAWTAQLDAKRARVLGELGAPLGTAVMRCSTPSILRSSSR